MLGSIVTCSQSGGPSNWIFLHTCWPPQAPFDQISQIVPLSPRYLTPKIHVYISKPHNSYVQHTNWICTTSQACTQVHARDPVCSQWRNNHPENQSLIHLMTPAVPFLAMKNNAQRLRCLTVIIWRGQSLLQITFLQNVVPVAEVACTLRAGTVLKKLSAQMSALRAKRIPPCPPGHELRFGVR